MEEKLMKIAGYGLLLVLLCTLMVGCGGKSLPPGVDADTVAGKISQNKDLTTFAQALVAADLLELLNAGDYTVFAPSDAAFMAYGALPQGDDLKRLLDYHVVNDVFEEAKLKTTPLELETVAGSTILVTVVDSKIVLNGQATLTQVNITGSNGVVHIIDKVLVLPRPTN
jgi:transforming growth factor-beta-induced protein